jgi:glutamine amidotransferase
MCRLLAVKSPQPRNVAGDLHRFAEISRHSKEYQGHGWGCALLEGDGSWRIHKSIDPVWTDDLGRFGSTTILLAHARSAFRNEGIAIENNMPFVRDDVVFIFNGELRGVRIREEGRIGAEKVFNVIRRFEEDGLAAAIERAVKVIERRSRYVRAMNMILSDGRAVHAISTFNEDPDYFTMYHRADGDAVIVCSDRWPATEGWEPINPGEALSFS